MRGFVAVHLCFLRIGELIGWVDAVVFIGLPCLCKGASVNLRQSMRAVQPEVLQEIKCVALAGLKPGGCAVIMAFGNPCPMEPRNRQLATLTANQRSATLRN